MCPVCRSLWCGLPAKHQSAASPRPCDPAPLTRFTKRAMRLMYTEQGAFFDGADGPSSRKQGWNGLLERLAATLG
jgi:hypothetical protein